MTVKSQKPVGWKNIKYLHSPLKVGISELNKWYVKIYKVAPKKIVSYKLAIIFYFSFFKTGILYIALVALELSV